MKKIILASVTAAAVLGGSAASIASASAAPGGAAIPRAQTASIDGQELFTGLFFAQGPLVHQLVGAHLANSTEQITHNNTPQAHKAGAEIVRSISKHSPGFFSRFSGELRSGSPQLVQQAVNDGAGEIKALAAKGDRAAVSPDSGLCVWNVVAAANAFVALNAVSVGNVVTQVNFWVGSSPQGSHLSQEQAIAALTKQLRA